MGKTAGALTLGEYLVREGFISQQQFSKALEEQRATMRSLGRILVDMGLITESMRMTILQKQFGFELMRLKGFKADPLLLSLIPYTFAEKHRIVPVKQDSRTLIVAMEDPSDILLLDALKHQVGMPLQPAVASQDDIQQVLDQYQTGAETVQQQLAAALRPEAAWHRVLRLGAFPVLALAPMAGFLAAVMFNINEFGVWLQKQHSMGFMSWPDLFLYILLVWGLWTIILFEIDGLIFHKGSKPDRDEDGEA